MIDKDDCMGVPPSIYPLSFAWLANRELSMEYREPQAPDIYTIKYLHVRVDSSNSKLWVKIFPELDNLEYLEIRGVITERILNAICRIPNLKRLDADRVRASQIDMLADLEKIEYLSLTGLSTVSSLDAVNSLSNLKSLYLSFGRKIKSLSELDGSNLPNLRFLMISSNTESQPALLEDIAGVSSLSTLEYFIPWHVRCEDPNLSCLEKLPNLKVFGCYKRRCWPDYQLQTLEDNGVYIKSIVPNKTHK